MEKHRLDKTIERLQMLTSKFDETPDGGMKLYRGTFNIESDPKDTFLNVKKWGKVSYLHLIFTHFL